MDANSHSLSKSNPLSAHRPAHPQFRNPFSTDRKTINIAAEHASHRDERFVREMAAWDPFRSKDTKK